MRARYIIQGYTEMTPSGICKDVSTVKVEASNGNEALEKAKTLLRDKPTYRIEEVVELPNVKPIKNE